MITIIIKTSRRRIKLIKCVHAPILINYYFFNKLTNVINKYLLCNGNLRQK